MIAPMARWKVYLRLMGQLATLHLRGYKILDALWWLIGIATSRSLKFLNTTILFSPTMDSYTYRRADASLSGSGPFAKRDWPHLLGSCLAYSGLYYSLPSPVGIVCLHCVRRSQLDALWMFQLGKLFLKFRVHHLHFCVFSTCVRVDTLEKRHLQARCICFVVGFVTSLSHIQDFVHHV